jgi:hypothetical protein
MIKPRTQTGQSSGGVAVAVAVAFRGYRGIAVSGHGS